MKLNFLIDAAFRLLKAVAPSLTPKSFLDALREYFDPNLSDAENKERIMGAIRKGIFGERLAEAADPNVQADPTIEAQLLSQQPANESSSGTTNITGQTDTTQERERGEH